jgi:hypothetical protein
MATNNGLVYSTYTCLGDHTYVATVPMNQQNENGNGQFETYFFACGSTPATVHYTVAYSY